MLAEHKLDFLHLKEFQSHGRHSSVSVEKKRAVFHDVAIILQQYRLHTVSAVLRPEQYKTHFGHLFSEKQVSLYTMCFLMMAVMNNRLAENADHKRQIPFVMDDGNPYARQVQYLHTHMRRHSMAMLPNLGGLSFGDDRRIIPLQAADAIAWAARRKLTTEKFPEGFEPLANVIDADHIDNGYDDELLTTIATALRNRITEASQPPETDLEPTPLLDAESMA